MSEAGALLQITQRPLDVNAWLERPPTVQEARPGRCPCCGEPSQPAGRSLRIWGDGTRERQVRGPLFPGKEPVVITIAVRLFVCRVCGRRFTIGPIDMVRGRLFSAGAMGLALARYGAGAPPPQVRRETSPWKQVGPTATTGWATLRRWARAVREGRLFGIVRLRNLVGSLRDVACHAAAVLAARALPSETPRSLEVQAFLGAARMA